MADIRKVSDRSSGLIESCEICGIRGGSAIVPFKVEYWPVEQSGKGGDVAYRCVEHKLAAKPDPCICDYPDRARMSMAQWEAA